MSKAKSTSRTLAFPEEISVFIETTEGGARSYPNLLSDRKNTCSSLKCISESKSKPCHRRSICAQTYTGFFNLLAGFGAIVVGFLLGIGWFSIKNITSSQQNVEHKIPIYLTAVMMVISGLLSIISSRKRFKYLVLLVVFLSIVCTMFCFVSFIYLSTEVNVRFNQLEDCSFLASDRICQCYVPDNGGRKMMQFKSVQSCDSVQENLKELVYGVCVLFGIGFVISAISAVASSYLLYSEQKRKAATRMRTCGDGSMHMTSITTQTQESCFQHEGEASNPGPSTRTRTERRERNNLSVGTQTPIYMMPVAQLVYDLNGSRPDYHMGILMPGEPDEPPPPYTDAVTAP